MALVARLTAFPKAFPFAFNLGVATTKTSAADVLTQTVVERKSFGEIDWKRNASFAVFGFAYLGGFQYWLQVTMFSRWFKGAAAFTELSFADKLKSTSGLILTGKQIAFDIVLHMPFMYFPTFYVVKEAVQGTGNPLVGLGHYKENFLEDQQKCVSVWLPADLVIFSAPMWLRLPSRHVVSFGWTAYVSFLRGGGGGGGDPDKPLQRKPTPM